jgi:hypothetical protein
VLDLDEREFVDLLGCVRRMSYLQLLRLQCKIDVTMGACESELHVSTDKRITTPPPPPIIEDEDLLEEIP